MTQKTVQVQVQRHYDSPPEKVFDAWLDPKVAGRFLFATPNGQMVKVEIDARIGGHFNFTDRRAEHGDVEHVGTYLEIDRPRRLTFEFAVPKYEPTRTKVAIEIGPSDSGAALTLTHDGVFEEYAAQTQQGWGTILESLEKAIG